MDNVRNMKNEFLRLNFGVEASASIGGTSQCGLHAQNMQPFGFGAAPFRMFDVEIRGR